MRVLGIDPGLTRCGVGIVEGVPGKQCKLVAYYVVRSEPDEHIALRLLNLDRTLTALVAEHKPESVAVERVFSQHNIRTVMGTAQASAVAILAGSRAGLPVETYTPSEVKAAVSGSGTAGKAQVTAMVTRILGLDAPPRPADAADALAIAICHIWRGGTRARLQAAAVRAATAAGAARSAIATRNAAVARDKAVRKAAADRTAAARDLAARKAAADRPLAAREATVREAAADRPLAAREAIVRKAAADGSAGARDMAVGEAAVVRPLVAREPAARKAGPGRPPAARDLVAPRSAPDRAAAALDGAAAARTAAAREVETAGKPATAARDAAIARRPA